MAQEKCHLKCNKSGWGNFLAKREEKRLVSKCQFSSLTETIFQFWLLIQAGYHGNDLSEIFRICEEKAKFITGQNKNWDFSNECMLTVDYKAGVDPWQWKQLGSNPRWWDQKKERKITRTVNFKAKSFLFSIVRLTWKLNMHYEALLDQKTLSSGGSCSTSVLFNFEVDGESFSCSRYYSEPTLSFH